MKHLLMLASTLALASRNRQVDVAVIGSGFSGLSAAIEAANCLGEDGKVLIVEKMDRPGGNSVMNAGQIAAVGSLQQKEAHIQDSVELMMSDMMKAGNNLNHPQLLQKMIEESWETVQWTEKEFGIQYRTRVTQLGGHSVPRTLSTLNASGNDIILPMLQKVQAKPNIELLLNTEFQKFIMSSDGQRVEGIQVKSHPQGLDDASVVEESLLCSRGVVLASGGFGADVAFRSIQNPAFGEHVMTTNQPGATAEVLKAALKIGALPVQLSHIQLGPWTSPDETGFGNAPFFCLSAGFPYGIIVDPQTSQRFVNELGNRYERSMAILQSGHPSVCLTDSEGAKHSLKADLAELAPAVQSYASLETLALAYGTDPSVLEQTVRAYNEGVRAGQDAFGKPLRDDLTPIEKPPFYATRLWPKVHHTMGGLHINTHAQVMNIEGQPIAGLFAAGEVAGGVHGADRLGSCATLDCIAFGRIAGHEVASMEEEEKKHRLLE